MIFFGWSKYGDVNTQDNMEADIWEKGVYHFEHPVWRKPCLIYSFSFAW